MYNGVDSAPNSAVGIDEIVKPREPPKRVNPDDVVRAGALEPGAARDRDSLQHRAFSFEGTRGDENSNELYE